MQLTQWFGNDTKVIGVYEPDYSPHSGSRAGDGKLIEWNAADLRWMTPDGSKPKDQSKECSILSHFATALNLECEEAITVTFVIGFGSLLLVVLVLFLIFKRR